MNIDNDLHSFTEVPEDSRLAVLETIAVIVTLLMNDKLLLAESRILAIRCPECRKRIGKPCGIKRLRGGAKFSYCRERISVTIGDDLGDKLFPRPKRS